MALTITVGKAVINVLPQLKSKTLKIFKKSNFKHLLEARFNWLVGSSNHRFIVGEEIIVKEGATFLFGGIIQEAPKVRMAVDMYEYNVFATSYEQLLSGRTVSIESYSGLAGDLVTAVCTNWLITTSATSEDMTIGTISDGITLENFFQPIITIKRLFDILAKQCGFIWYITDEKVINFVKQPLITQAPYDIFQDDLAQPRRNDDVMQPTLRPNLAEFRNKQWFVGRNEDGQVIYAGVDDADSITNMSTRYGSGIIGSIEYDNRLLLESECIEAAEAYLDKTRDEPNEFSFITRKLGYDINQYFVIAFDDLDLVNEKRYVTTKVIIRDREAFISYNVFADQRGLVDGEDIASAPKKNWTEVFDQFNDARESSDTYENHVFMYNDATEDVTDVVANKNRNVPLILPNHIFVDVLVNGTLSTGDGDAIMSADVLLGTYNEISTDYDYESIKVFDFDYKDGESRSHQARVPILDKVAGKYNVKIEYSLDNVAATLTCADAKDLFFWVTSKGLDTWASDYVPIFIPAPPPLSNVWQEDLVEDDPPSGTLSGFSIVCLDESGDMYMQYQGYSGMIKFNVETEIWDDTLADKPSAIRPTNAHNDDYLFTVDSSGSIHVYDKALDTWTEYVTGEASVTNLIIYNNKVYVFGNTNYKFIIFDIATLSFDTPSSATLQGSIAASYLYGDKLFQLDSSSHMFIYDISLDTWDLSDTGPAYNVDDGSPRLVNNRAYFNSNGTDIGIYNCATELWEAKVNLISAGYTGGSYTFYPSAWYTNGTKGYQQVSAYPRRFVEFDTLTNTFGSIALAEASQDWYDVPNLETHNNRIYVVSVLTPSRILRYVIGEAEAGSLWNGIFYEGWYTSTSQIEHDTGFPDTRTIMVDIDEVALGATIRVNVTPTGNRNRWVQSSFTMAEILATPDGGSISGSQADDDEAEGASYYDIVKVLQAKTLVFYSDSTGLEVVTSVEIL